MSRLVFFKQPRSVTLALPSISSSAPVLRRLRELFEARSL